MVSRKSILLGVTVLLGSAVSCNDPTGFTSRVAPSSAGGGQAPDSGPPPLPENCPASPEWFPITPSLEGLNRLFTPAPHPNTECPFYRGGLQTFLIAMQPDPTSGEPAIVTYATIDDLFTKTTPLPPGALAPPGTHRGTVLRAWLGAVKQAGQRRILIDQNGHTLYYGIHVNDAFVAFCNDHGLHTLEDVVNADPSLSFPAGVAEFKTAWMDIDPKDGVTGDFSNYITTTAWVSTLTQDSSAAKTILEDPDHPRLIKVALVAAHAVYSLPGHPEFVWTSLQHVNQGGGSLSSNQGAEVGVTPNSAPALQNNPSDSDPDNLMISDPAATTGNYLLYKPNTPVQLANAAYSDPDLALDPNDPTQIFRLSSDNSIAQTSIYREFPGSKSNDVHPDDAVVSLNSNFAQLVKQMAPDDPRGNYRLIGGTWLDKPPFFRLGSDLQIESSPLYAEMTPQDEGAFANISQHDVDPGGGSPGRLQLLMAGITPAQDVHDNGTDSPFSIMAGENRMSSTAMESFTQSALPSSFANCFACHNTQGVTDSGTPVGKGAGNTLLTAKLINVSHVFSEFVRDECNANPTAKGCN